MPTAAHTFFYDAQKTLQHIPAEFYNRMLDAGVKGGGLLEIPDGDYADVLARVSASGTGERKTILRAAHAGKVRFTGMSALTVEADDVDLIGLRFEDGGIPPGRKNILEVRGARVRIAECSFVDYNRGGGGKQWVRLSGKYNVFESNHLAGKTTVDPTLQVEVSSNEPNETVIRWNHFGPRPPLGQNGGETIRIGYSQQATFVSRTFVHENLFEACDGEVEIISCKSGENFFLQIQSAGGDHAHIDLDRLCAAAAGKAAAGQNVEQLRLFGLVEFADFGNEQTAAMRLLQQAITDTPTLSETVDALLAAVFLG